MKSIGGAGLGCPCARRGWRPQYQETSVPLLLSLCLWEGHGSTCMHFGKPDSESIPPSLDTMFIFSQVLDCHFCLPAASHCLRGGGTIVTVTAPDAISFISQEIAQSMTAKYTCHRLSTSAVWAGCYKPPLCSSFNPCLMTTLRNGCCHHPIL